MSVSGSDRPNLPGHEPLLADVQAAATTSLILEIIFGFFSLLGVGHVYTGRIGLGLALMFGWWVFLAIAATVSSLTAGITACLFVPIYLAAPIISGIQASAYVKRTGVTGSWRSFAIVVGAGCVVVIVCLMLVAFFLGLATIGVLGALFQSQ